jgi:hypothetical protein
MVGCKSTFQPPNTATQLRNSLILLKANAHCYPVWASLARDHLAIIASSVSSEWAFSSTGITISKCQNRLKPDVVEALQCLKFMIKWDLFFWFDPSIAAYEMQEEKAASGLDSEANSKNGKSWDEMWIVDDDDEVEGVWDV